MKITTLRIVGEGKSATYVAEEYFSEGEWEMRDTYEDPRAQRHYETGIRVRNARRTRQR